MVPLSVTIRSDFQLPIKSDPNSHTESDFREAGHSAPHDHVAYPSSLSRLPLREGAAHKSAVMS